MQRFLKLTLILLVLVVVPINVLGASDTAGKIKNLQIMKANGDLRIEIDKSGDIEFKLFFTDDPKRLVVDCVGAKNELGESTYQAESRLIYRVRTSQFKTAPVPVSRLVFDLKKSVNHRIFEVNNKQVLLISDTNGSDVGDISLNDSKTENTVDAPDPVSEVQGLPETEEKNIKPMMEENLSKKAVNLSGDSDKTENRSEAERNIKKDEQKVDSPWIEGNSDDTADKPVSAISRVAENQTVISSAGSEIVVDNSASRERFDNLPWSKSYVRGAPAVGSGIPMGSKRITLDAQGADIKTVLQTISDYADINIVPGNDVKGDVFVHIKDCPWQEALEVILKAHGYGYREEYGMIRVGESKRLLREELDHQSAKSKEKSLLPLRTRIVFVDNSNAEEIGDALKNVVSKRGKIDVDPGSNTLIINDIEENLDKISAIVKELDTKHVQVNINAKLVEMDVEAKRELGIKWDLLNLHKSDVNAIGSAGLEESLPLTSGTLKIGSVQSWGQLNSILEMMEESNKANIISNPRITTMENREATILVGKEIPLIVADEAGNPLTELTKIGIMLKVTPHVNKDRTITLDLHPEVSELQSESTQQGGVIIATAEADTRVEVANGETAIIGGLIKKLDTNVRRGIPFLKDIPYLGALFSSSSKSKKKQELVIFVTPTIVE
ncbi:MAG: AMIN domain-containing protein [Candidatus Krumholzibacteriota bacterium]|nr:AMIN domain-containing protein [Candidatus Krumholzibacteriota bacterium]